MLSYNAERAFTVFLCALIGSLLLFSVAIDLDTVDRALLKPLMNLH